MMLFSVCFILFLLVVSIIESLTALSATSLSDTKKLNHRQIFVAEIYPNQLENVQDELFTAFGRYGPVEKVAVHGIEEFRHDTGKGSRKRRPYAFVTFFEETSADSAIAAFSTSTQKAALYRQVKAPTGPDTWRRRAKPILKDPNENLAFETELIESLLSEKKVDVILQVNKSHLDRVVEYLPIVSHNGAQVVGIIESTPRKKLSLILVRLIEGVTTGKHFIEDCLGKDKYIHKALNKVYFISGKEHQNFIHGTESDICTEAYHILSGASQEDEKTPIVLKVEAFPSNTRRRVLAMMETALPTNVEVKIAPTGHTHILNVVRVDNPALKKEDMNVVDGQKGYFLWGISEVFDAVIGDGEGTPESETSCDVSRAYYKLQEAFGRQEGQNDLFVGTTPTVALDCGAAPGGWTKYLSDETPCQIVYSVDPGELAPSVAIMPGVHHLPIKVEDALPQLIEQGIQVDIWVSDMCLHNMSTHIDFLFKSQSILRENALFILTLKCVAGYKKSAYDAQVQRQVKRLDSFATGVTVTHLFSNRLGERTVMGFLKQREQHAKS